MQTAVASGAVPVRLSRNLLVYWGCCALLLVLVHGAFIVGSDVLEGHNDFLHFYAGALLAGTPDLYSYEASANIHRQVTGAQFLSLHNVRLPFYYLFLKPLTALPFRTAHGVFLALNLVSFGVFVLLFVRRASEIPLLAVLSMPLLFSIMNGQDVLLVMTMASAAVLLASERRDAAAGVLFSLCAIKFHLFLLVPLVVIVYRRWRILWSATAGGAVLLTISFAVAGWKFPWQMAASATSTAANPALHAMPTMNGLAASLGLSPVAGWALAAIAAAFASTAIFRAGSFERAMGVAFVAGPLLAYHAYIQDAILVLAGFALLHGGLPRVPRVALTIAILPPLYLMMMLGTPWNAGIHIALLVVLALLAR